MKKYDPDAKCIKCGSEDIKNEHEKERDKERADILNLEHRQRFGFGNPHQPYPERIQRTCNNCGCIWHEAPLDGDTLPEENTKKVCDMFRDPTAPVIEARDVVKRSGQGCEDDKCKVLELSEGRAILGRISHPCGCDEDVRDLTLICKGPKVHTFEGVRLKSKGFDDGIHSHGFGICEKLRPGMIEVEVMFEGNMEQYHKLPEICTLTFKEDTP